MRARPFLSRLLLCALAMLLLSLAASIVLGWAAREHQPRLTRVLGYERSLRLYHSYFRTIAALFPTYRRRRLP